MMHHMVIQMILQMLHMVFQMVLQMVLHVSTGGSGQPPLNLSRTAVNLSQIVVSFEESATFRTKVQLPGQLLNIYPRNLQ